MIRIFDYISTCILYFGFIFCILNENKKNIYISNELRWIILISVENDYILYYISLRAIFLNYFNSPIKKCAKKKNTIQV